MDKEIFTILFFKIVLYFFSFLKLNVCHGYSIETSQWDSSIEHLKLMLKLMDKVIFTILH